MDPLKFECDNKQTVIMNDTTGTDFYKITNDERID
jgi:hypothetical protein